MMIECLAWYTALTSMSLKFSTPEHQNFSVLVHNLISQFEMKISILKYTDMYRTVFCLMSVATDKDITAVCETSSTIYTHMKWQLNYLNYQKDYFTK